MYSLERPFRLANPGIKHLNSRLLLSLRPLRLPMYNVWVNLAEGLALQDQYRGIRMALAGPSLDLYVVHVWILIMIVAIYIG